MKPIKPKTSNRMKYKIAVSGAAEIRHCSKNIEEISKKLGREIARQNCILISGATTGVPYFATLGCKEEGGISIGFSPAASKSAHQKVYRLPLDYLDLVVYTGFDYTGRNLLMTRAADAVVVCCGRMGTLNEFTIAFEDRKPIGVLEGSGGTADLIKVLTRRPHRKRAKIIHDPDPEILIQRLVRLLKKQKGRK